MSSRTVLPLFRSANQASVLGWLFVSADGPASISEVARVIHVPVTSVHREIDDLEQAGIVRSQIRGRSRLVEANPDSPLHEELSRLLLKTLGPLPLLQTLLAELVGIDEAFLFGSWARRYLGERGEAPADIDVLVVGEPDPDEVFDVASEAAAQLALQVDPVIVSRAEWEGPRDGFFERIKAGPLIRVI